MPKLWRARDAGHLRTASWSAPVADAPPRAGFCRRHLGRGPLPECDDPRFRSRRQRSGCLARHLRRALRADQLAPAAVAAGPRPCAPTPVSILRNYPMSQPDLIHLPLSQLSISKLNMRHGRKAPDVSDILPSIRDKGVRQTLLVRREAGGYGIVAGRRRFFALQQIAKEAGTDPLVPCAVMPE